jgi:hypothetical protein
MPATPRVSIGPLKLFKVGATPKDAAHFDNQINRSINCTRVIDSAKAQELAAEFVRVSALFLKESAASAK